MARPKRKSRALIKAEIRLSGMKSIDLQLDLGDGFNVDAYTSKIDILRQQLATYNQLLADLDTLGGTITEMERDLRSYSAKILTGVEYKFGKTSFEYEKVGGIRQIERLRSSRRSTDAATSTASLPPAESTESTEPAGSVG